MTSQESQLPPSLERTVKELSTTFDLNWEQIRKHLTGEGFGKIIVDSNEEAIQTLYLNSQAKHAQSRLNPPLPPSPPEELHLDSAAYPPIPHPNGSPQQGLSLPMNLRNGDKTRKQVPPPKDIQVCLNGSTYDTMACDYDSEAEENLIRSEVLHQRRIQNRVLESKIRLTWRAGPHDRRTYTTLFRVVGEENIENCDIIFGRNCRLGPELDKQGEIQQEKKRKDPMPDEMINVEQRSNKRQQNALNTSFHPVVPSLLAATVSEYVKLHYPPQMPFLPDLGQGHIFGAGRCQETEGSDPSESPTMQSHASSQAQSWDAP